VSERSEARNLEEVDSMATDIMAEIRLHPLLNVRGVTGWGVRRGGCDETRSRPLSSPDPSANDGAGDGRLPRSTFFTNIIPLYSFGSLHSFRSSFIKMRLASLGAAQKNSSI